MRRPRVQIPEAAPLAIPYLLQNKTPADHPGRCFVFLEEEVKSYEPGVTAGFAFTKIAGFTGLVGLAGTVALAAVRAASKAALAAALASLVVAAASAVLRVARAASMVA